MLTQVAGLNLAAPFLWRYVFFLSFSLAAVQYLSSSVIVESPAFLLRKGRLEEHKTAARRLWGNTIPSLACELTGISVWTHLLMHTSRKLKKRFWIANKPKLLMLLGIMSPFRKYSP